MVAPINYFQQLGFQQPTLSEQTKFFNSINDRGFQNQARQMAVSDRIQSQSQQAQNQLSKEYQYRDAQDKAEALQAQQELYSALNSGDPRAAESVIMKYQDKIAENGDPEAVGKAMQMLQTPEGAAQLKQRALDMIQMSAGPENFAKFTAQQQPKPAEPMTQYQQASTDLRRQELDLRKEESKLQAMLKAQAATANEIKKQELQLKIEEQQNKLADAQSKREQSKRDAQSSLQSGLQSTDNLLSTLDQILKTPIGVVESATGPISTKLPTLSQDTADFEELITKFDSQAFIAQIPMLKGTGALSDSEGRKLSASLQNLSLRQSQQQLIKNVREARQIMQAARQNLINKSGLRQDQGEPQLQPAKTSATESVVDWSQL